MFQVEHKIIYQISGGLSIILIGFFSWLVVGQFDNRSSIGVVQTETKSTKDIVEKMWVLVQENNKILGTKASEQENKEQHEKIMLKMESLEIGLREVAAGRKYSSCTPDTTNRYGGTYNKATTKPIPLMTDN